jgi:hypothetical protein
VVRHSCLVERLEKLSNSSARIVFAAIIATCACTPQWVDVSVGTTEPFVGKTWLLTDPSAPPGTFRIFLPDGTLVMDSCVETYRLVKWRRVDERRIEWEEDTAKIEADLSQSAPDQLQLRLRLGGEVTEQRYRLATVPFVCPDMPR